MRKDLWKFLKNPIYQEDENTDLKYRLGIFAKLLGCSLLISIVLGILINALPKLLGIDLGDHAMELIFEDYSPIFVLFAAVVLAPVLEETIFRAPMALFKKSSWFFIIFYVFTLAFGFYHITNFEISTAVLLLSPLLVAPQISIGAFLGFIRVRFGFVWALLLHATYNLILIGPIILLKLLDIPLE